MPEIEGILVQCFAAGLSYGCDAGDTFKIRQLLVLPGQLDGPSLVYLADMYGIYKSNVPLLIKKISFEVKHCKIETVFISRSTQAGKLKKTCF